ncbi:MAG TPA: hypothetical protein VGE40_04220, partial [Bacilli bacterium]
ICFTKEGFHVFDPTIYENLKVVIEGAVYDLDLSNKIYVTNRTDRVELSSMSRYYAIRFELRNQRNISAEICLIADVSDLASEILDREDPTCGCRLEIRIYTLIHNVAEECSAILGKLKTIWGNEHRVGQKISFLYNELEPPRYHNEITIHFQRKIGENQIEDIPNLIDCVLQSLESLSIDKYIKV